MAVPNFGELVPNKGNESEEAMIPGNSLANAAGVQWDTPAGTGSVQLSSDGAATGPDEDTGTAAEQ